jgi:hypothetical protein
MDSLLEGLDILISTSCACGDGFQGLSKDFSTLYSTNINLTESTNLILSAFK